MKIRVTLKDPDTMPDAVEEAFRRQPKPDGLSDEEWEDVRDERAAAAKERIAKRWMEYSEYLDVEFDLEADTARVVPRSK